MNNKILLSVVIISRNIERYIGRCIESVLDATSHLKNIEIILVDSASTDNTLNIARKYPIKILKIENSAPLSPAAGRYIGSLYTKGKYVHFQDGDSLIYKGWFKNALPFLESHDEIAGVVGIITQEEYNNRVAKRWIQVNKKQKTGPVNDYESFILVRKEVLEKVGSFNPWLKFKEEGEFASRLLDAGFEIQRLPYKVSHHLGYEKENFFTEMKRKISSTYALGRIFRHYIRNKRIRDTYLRGTWRLILLATCYSLFLLSLPFSRISGSTQPIYASLSLLFLAYLLITAKKRAFTSSISTIFSITLRWPFLIFGFIKGLKMPYEYPAKIEVIKA